MRLNKKDRRRVAVVLNALNPQYIVGARVRIRNDSYHVSRGYLPKGCYGIVHERIPDDKNNRMIIGGVEGFNLMVSISVNGTKAKHYARECDLDIISMPR